MWLVLDRLSVLAMLSAAAFITWTTWRSQSQATAAVGPPGVVIPIEGRLPPTFVRQYATKGGGSARAILIEFSDFQCPFCRRHAIEVLPALEREYVDPGRLRYAFAHFPLDRLHRQARRAAETAECAGKQGQFWQMHDRLFANPKDLSEQVLFAHATDLKLHLGEMSRCVSEDAAAVVTGDGDLARRFGIESTPVFLVGEAQSDGSIVVTRKIAGAHPLSVFRSVLDQVQD